MSVIISHQNPITLEEFREQFKDKSFWNESHPLSETHNKLWEELVPASDNAPTIEGELLRAATRLHYDCFNNGLGCNNYTGAARMLASHTHIPSLRLALSQLETNIREGYYDGNNKRNNLLTEYVLHCVVWLKDVETKTPNDNNLDFFNWNVPLYEDEDEDY